jgi:alkanesulfonate monooxygenase SsuD/methylene tetrahydromethanopterin reductase-like flavin-dependent oxidoreductase (luciferase family)
MNSDSIGSPWQLRLDMRRAPTSPTSRQDLYKSALEMCAYADKNGCSNVIISEHHGSADGYLPSALTMAAAIAAVTDRTRLSISALVLPLLEPVHTAEETLVVDQISGGRVDVIVGLGYVRSELAMFGLEDHNRVSLLEEKLPIYLNALTGKSFAVGDQTIAITPGPVQKPRPQVLLAATVPAAARRAARLADGVHCIVPRDLLAPDYLAERERLGLDQGMIVGGDASSASLFVSNDPERTWSALAPYLLHEVNSYGKWAQENGANEHLYQPTDDLKVVREMGMYEVARPEEAQKFVAAAGTAGPVLQPLVGGIPPEVGWEMLERFVNDVLPKTRESPVSARERRVGEEGAGAYA